MGEVRAAAATPGSTKAIVRLIYESDVRDVLPAIRVPTLVIHREAAMGFSVEHGRYLAEHIPGAKYVELPGADNLIWAGDQDAIVAEIQDFVTGVRPVLDPRRVLATVLFTDIVGSTQLAAELGDTRWQRLLADHNRIVRHQLERFGGTEVKVIGDGFLATFDGPARAVRCAAAIRDEVTRARARDPRRAPRRRDRGPGRTTSPASRSTSLRGSRPRPGPARSSSRARSRTSSSGRDWTSMIAVRTI